jgi:hypothetical protein
MSMSDWAKANTFLRKQPFSLKGYEFQKQILDDMHPNIDVRKCSQVGLTELQIRKALGFLMRNTGVKLIYTFPNEKMFKKVSKTRIQPMVESNPIFNPEGSGKWARSMDLMQFDESYMLVTASTEGDATSTDADAVFSDEVDLTDQKMLALFRSRMQNSSHRLNQRFSTPTHVGFGIDKGFGLSDQQEYLCRCHACGYAENMPDFTREYANIPGLPDHVQDLSHIDTKMLDSLDLDGAFFMCKRCRAPLDLDNPDGREWVPKHPSRSQVARGYNVLPTARSKLDIKYIVSELLSYRSRDFVRGWYNTVLGLPYTDSNARLSEVDIKANFVQQPAMEMSADEPCFLGIDAGLICHVVIGRPLSDGMLVTQFLTVPADNLVAWVEDFMTTHNVVGGAMDRHPYTPTANAVFEMSDGKVFPVEYRGQREINDVKNESDEITYFQANRTDLIDEVVKLIRRRKLPMAGYEHFEHIVIEHLRDMVRDEQPEKEATWVKLNQNDHYFHALGFLLFARKISNFILMQNESEIRVMCGVIGIDVKTSSDSLSGTATRPKQRVFNTQDPDRLGF